MANPGGLKLQLANGGKGYTFVRIGASSNEWEDIIDRIKSRLAGNDKPPRYPPTSEEILAKAEANLGFAIPPLLRQIYAHAANGGFGPGYGIIGVEEGHASHLGDVLVETYAEIKRGADYHDLKWKEGVLASLVGGAAIFSRVWTAMIHVTRLFNQTNAGPMFRVTTWRTFLPCGLRVWTSWEPATLAPEGPQKSSIPSHGRRCESLAEVAPGVQDAGPKGE